LSVVLVLFPHIFVTFAHNSGGPNDYWYDKAFHIIIIIIIIIIGYFLGFPYTNNILKYAVDRGILGKLEVALGQQKSSQTCYRTCA
jgi:hypothetical protein